MKLCGGCSTSLADGVKRRGWWKLVNPGNAAYFARHWIKGTAHKDRIDPYVVASLELFCHATKKARILPQADVCPICEGALRLGRPTLELRAQWIDGVLDQLIRPLLASNGLTAEKVERKRGRIITDFTELSINGGRPQQ